MAFAPQLWMLLLGRAIAGLSSANVSVAMANITDISPEGERARRFGLFNAMFGAGFIVGPVIGGLLGDYWLRLPFIKIRDTLADGSSLRPGLRATRVNVPWRRDRRA